MVTSAFLQEQGNGKLLQESALLKEGLTARGIAVTLFTRKKIDRRQLPLTPAALVAGAYTIGAESYTDLILARWSELMAKPAEHAVDPEA